MPEKKKVYVETTVVSDATALPTRDIVQAGRQLVTRYDSTLEEMWRIKREIAAEYPSLEAYFKGFLADQAARERGGVKFVHFAPRRVESAMA